MKLNPAKFYLCHVVKELKILLHTLKEEKVRERKCSESCKKLFANMLTLSWRRPLWYIMIWYIYGFYMITASVMKGLNVDIAHYKFSGLGWTTESILDYSETKISHKRIRQSFFWKNLKVAGIQCRDKSKTKFSQKLRDFFSRNKFQ